MRKNMKLFLLAGLALVCGLLFSGMAKAEPKSYEMIVPEADVRVYTEEELEGMTAQVACYARNEIYARHGRKFRSVELTEWFAEQPWYNGSIEPDDFSDNMLNAYESSNVDLLLKIEKARTEDGGGYHLNEPDYSFEEVQQYLYGHMGEDGFNILEGLEVYATSATVFMDGNHFYMMIPNNLNWGYEQLDARTFEIYHKPARETGFGGKVVSIMAMDLDDETYQEFPHWQICGESSDKRYIALFPTDVQFNGNDSAQKEEYNKLLEWAYTLNVDGEEGSNPFEVVEEEEADMIVGDRAE